MAFRGCSVTFTTPPVSLSCVSWPLASSLASNILDLLGSGQAALEGRYSCWGPDLPVIPALTPLVWREGCCP